MHLIDILLVVVPLVALVLLALWTRQFVKNVADYISAGRCAGRYLLANAVGEGGSGVTNTVSWFELFMISGFITVYWGWISGPIALIIAISGFVVYRYRETRCLTIAQFYEMRYSPRLRLFMGLIGCLAGVLNYGIFPAVSARFFIYFLDLPATVPLFGLDVSTFLLIMAAYLGTSTAMIIFGGQVTLMVTDCVEGIFTHGVYILICAVLLFLIPWSDIAQCLAGAAPAGAPPDPAAAMALAPNKSLVNPFDAFDLKGFNFWYVVLGICSMLYGTMVWQGGHSFRSAARTPHEGRMGGILGAWRAYARNLMLVVLVMCTMTFLRHPGYAGPSAPAKERIAAIQPQGAGAAPAPAGEAPPVGSQKWYDNGVQVNQLQKQQSVPVTLNYMLPTGIKGLFLLIMIMGLFAGDGNHLLSWSSIFVQDVYVPLRRRLSGKPLDTRAHLLALRIAVAGTALFAFAFSALVPPSMPIWFWWGITGAIYTAGAGALVLGGFYWKKGTTAGAWTAMVVGPTLAVGSIVVDFFWKDWFGGRTMLGIAIPLEKPYSMPWVSFGVMCTSALAYAVVSLLTCRRDFDLQKLLHRGQYAVKEDQAGVVDFPLKQKLSWRTLIGVDSHFTRVDTLVAAFIFFWSLAQVLALLFSAAWHWLAPAHLRWTNLSWAHFWLWFGFIIPACFTIITFVWFTIGGFRDLRAFFHALRTLTRDVHDDGSVTGSTGAPAGGAPAANRPQ